MEPQIKTTVVGSYPAPTWLSVLPCEQSLIDAMSVVFKIQENAGIDVVADGELYRFDVNHPDTNGMIEYFIRPLGNVRTALSMTDLKEFRLNADMAYRAHPSGVVEGPLNEGTLAIVCDYRRARALTRSALKFTVTGPHMLSKTLLDRHYKSRPKLCMAIAEILAVQIKEVGAEVVQIDEANIPGHPDEAPWALEGINHVLDAISTKAAVHLCFGNYGGQTIQPGGWDKLIGFLSGLHCDHVLLELAHRGNWELEHLAQVNPKIGIGLGVIDIKTNVIESAETIARNIEAAVKVLGEGRVKFVNPDCGFWMLPRSVADRKIRTLVQGRDLYEGRC